MTLAVCTLLHMSTDRDRVICVTLSEAEWQAFVARHPQPQLWLRERIRDEVVKAPERSTQSAA
jgi:hypothetical protein